MFVGKLLKNPWTCGHFRSRSYESHIDVKHLVYVCLSLFLYSSHLVFTTLYFLCFCLLMFLMEQSTVVLYRRSIALPAFWVTTNSIPVKYKNNQVKASISCGHGIYNSQKLSGSSHNSLCASFCKCMFYTLYACCFKVISINRVKQYKFLKNNISKLNIILFLT